MPTANVRAVTFTPAQLSGKSIWLRADAQTFQDITFATPAAANGDKVNGWKDQSGNNNDVATNSSANAAITLTTNAAGGRPVVSSVNAGALHLNSGTIAAITAGITVIAYARAPTSGTTATLSVSPGTVLQFNSTGIVTFQTVGGTAASNVYAFNTFYTMIGTCDGSNTTTVQVNNDAPVSLSSPTTLNESVFSFLQGNPAKADLAEIVVFNRLLNSTEISQMVQYMTEKYSGGWIP